MPSDNASILITQGHTIISSIQAAPVSTQPVVGYSGPTVVPTAPTGPQLPTDPRNTWPITKTRDTDPPITGVPPNAIGTLPEVKVTPTHVSNPVLSPKKHDCGCGGRLLLMPAPIQKSGCGCGCGCDCKDISNSGILRSENLNVVPIKKKRKNPKYIQNLHSIVYNTGSGGAYKRPRGANPGMTLVPSIGTINKPQNLGGPGGALGSGPGKVLGPVPPPSSPRIPYGHGPLLTNVDIITLFIGDWSIPVFKDIPNKINEFFKFIVRSPFMAMLEEYSRPGFEIGPGTFNTAFFTNTLPGIDFTNSDTVTILDSVLQHYLQNLIQNNSQLTPRRKINGLDQTLFMIYPSPFLNGKQIEIIKDNEPNMPVSCVSGMCGYHLDTLTLDGEHNVWYGVVPVPLCDICFIYSGTYPTPFFLSPDQVLQKPNILQEIIDAMTVTSSHELAEVITDPDGSTGWTDQFAEIGDLCVPKINGVYLPRTRLGGFLIQNIWSNVKNSCIGLPSGTKNVLSETSFRSPATTVTNINSKPTFILAWGGSNLGHNLNILPSTELDSNGLPKFGPKVYLNETTIDAPAVSNGPGDAKNQDDRLYIAWTGTDNSNTLNVAYTSDLQNFNKIELPETASYGPALAFANKTLYIAWVGTDPGRTINIRSSPDGVNWKNKYILHERTDAPPVLAVIKGPWADQLILLFRGKDSTRTLYICEINDLNGSMSMGRRINLAGDSSFYAPTLLQVGENLTLAWSSNDSARNLFLEDSLPDSNGNIGITGFLGNSVRFEYASDGNFPLTTFLGKSFITWTGVSNYNLNITELSNFVPI